MMLRDLAESWFKANCPPAAPIGQFMRNIDKAIQQRRNCWFRFGPRTTRKGGPYLVYCYEEEFFAFALNERQAKLLNLAAGQVVTASAGTRMRLDTHEPPATLTRLDLQVATTERIAGCVEYQMPHAHLLPYCLRMTWDRPDGPGVNMFHYPGGMLMPTGKIPFEFQLQSRDQSPVPPGLVLAFFSLNSVPENPTISTPVGIAQTLSDTHARLIELR